MTVDLMQTLQDTISHTAELINNHKTVSQAPCTQYNEFRDIVDPAILDLGIKKCNLYEETILIQKEFNLASKNFLECL